MERPRRLKGDAVFAQNLDFRFQFDSSFLPSGSPDLVNQTQNIRGGRLSAVHNEIPVLWRNLRLSYSGFLETQLINQLPCATDPGILEDASRTCGLGLGGIAMIFLMFRINVAVVSV